MAVDAGSVINSIVQIVTAISAILAAFKSNSAVKKADQASTERQLIARDLKETMK